MTVLAALVFHVLLIMPKGRLRLDYRTFENDLNILEL